MKKLTLLFLIPFLFISCDTMFSFLPETKKITEKTSYEPFSDLENVKVVSMTVDAKKYLWKNKSYTNMTDKLGDMFVIYDFDKHKVHDWVFYGDKNQRTWILPVKVETPTKRYVNPLIGKRKIVSIDPEKTQVDYINCSQIGLFYNYSTPNKYCVIDSTAADPESKKQLMYFTVLDTETGTTNTNKIVQKLECPEYVSALKPDSEGNFWFAYLLDGYAHIAKVDCEKETLTNFDKTFLCKENESDSSYKFAPKVLYIDDSLVFINKGKLGYGPYGENTLYIYDIKKDELTELDIKFPSDLFLKRIIKINNKYYGITTNSTEKGKVIDIFELDLQNNSIKHLTENTEFIINFTDEIWANGSKIYFLNSWDSTNLYYNYFDVDTCTQGDGWYINQKDIIGEL